MSAQPFIACGMYAFTEAHKQAWQELFDHFEPPPGSGARPRRELDFRHGEAVLRDPALYFGHTCGYPLMTQLYRDFTPFCTAEFEVPGCEGKFYSSRIIVNAESGADSLRECQGGVAAINSADSNSGMNALRYEVSRLGAQPGFFCDVVITGGHLHSVEAVAENRADVAAIDCVTFQLVVDAFPALAKRVRPVGFSVRTCGLPFVLPGRSQPANLKSRYTSALNDAFRQLSTASRQSLHLAGFAAVDLDDYASILELKRYARERGFNLSN